MELRNSLSAFTLRGGLLNLVLCLILILISMEYISSVYARFPPKPLLSKFDKFIKFRKRIHLQKVKPFLKPYSYLHALKRHSHMKQNKLHMSRHLSNPNRNPLHRFQKHLRYKHRRRVRLRPRQIQGRFLPKTSGKGNGNKRSPRRNQKINPRLRHLSGPNIRNRKFANPKSRIVNPLTRKLAKYNRNMSRAMSTGRIPTSPAKFRKIRQLQSRRQQVRQLQSRRQQVPIVLFDEPIYVVILLGQHPEFFEHTLEDDKMLPLLFDKRHTRERKYSWQTNPRWMERMVKQNVITARHIDAMARNPVYRTVTARRNVARKPRRNSVFTPERQRLEESASRRQRQSRPEVSRNRVATNQNDEGEDNDFVSRSPAAPQMENIARRILSSMNLSADPCQDFYEFACGSFIDRTVIPDNTGNVDAQYIIGQTTHRRLKGVLEVPIRLTEPRAIWKAKLFYQSCINQVPDSQQGIQDVQRMIREFGGWPVLGGAPGGNWDPDQFDLVYLLALARRYIENDHFPHPNGIIISMPVMKDFGEKDKFSLYFDDTGLGLESRSIYMRDRKSSLLSAYEEYAFDTVVALGADPMIARRDIEDLVNFEIDLANITAPPYVRIMVDYLYSKVSLQTLIDRWPQFDWLRFVNLVFDLGGSTIRVDREYQVVLWETGYYDKLFPLLQKWGDRTVANYIIWRSILPLLPAVNEEFRRHKLPLHQEQDGHGELVDRSKFCTETVNNGMGWASSRLYVQRYFTEAEKNKITEVASYIHRVFSETLANSNWMDEPTKEEALNKLNTLTGQIGYPEDLLNDTNLNQYYRNLQISRSRLVQNVKMTMLHNAVHQLERIRRVPDVDRWVAYPSMVNAFYSIGQNAFVFPAAVLQEPIFNLNVPRSLLFGAIGFLLGHEITHGFDIFARAFDHNALIRNWWTEDTMNNYLERSRCFIDQYNKFFDPDAQMNVDAERTLLENTADNGGLKIAHRAFTLWLEANGEEPNLPFLGFTPEQEFFISYAQVWCGKATKDFAQHFIREDIHSPNRFRVIGPLRNIPEFASAFSCRSNSPMNPEDTCAVW